MTGLGTKPRCFVKTHSAPQHKQDISFTTPAKKYFEGLFDWMHDLKGFTIDSYNIKPVEL